MGATQTLLTLSCSSEYPPPPNPTQLYITIYHLGPHTYITNSPKVISKPTYQLPPPAELSYNHIYSPEAAIEPDGDLRIQGEYVG